MVAIPPVMPSRTTAVIASAFSALKPLSSSRRTADSVSKGMSAMLFSCRFQPGAGLKRGLEDPRDVEATRDGFVEYLAHRALLTPRQVKFRGSISGYLQNPCDIHIYGCLVRFEPNQDDFRARICLGRGLNYPLCVIPQQAADDGEDDSGGEVLRPLVKASRDSM